MVGMIFPATFPSGVWPHELIHSTLATFVDTKNVLELIFWCICTADEEKYYM